MNSEGEHAGNAGQLGETNVHHTWRCLRQCPRERACNSHMIREAQREDVIHQGHTVVQEMLDSKAGSVCLMVHCSESWGHCSGRASLHGATQEKLQCVLPLATLILDLAGDAVEGGPPGPDLPTGGRHL